MTVLLDVVHPAHVHFYRHLHRHLLNEGVEVHVAARDKDVTHALLKGFGIPYVSFGRSGAKGTIRQLAELLRRDVGLARLIRRTGTRLVLTRNPAGVQAARLLGRTGVFDTDDGQAAGIHFRAAAPFAHVITTPTSITEDYGRRHRRYEGYKALAYLHPNVFRPDPSALGSLGIKPGTHFSIVRFVDMVASHDRNEFGLGFEDKLGIVDHLSVRGPVFVTSESVLPPVLERHRLTIAPHHLHDALAFASLYVGDSQTMAAEAALVGTPSVHISSWSRRLSYLTELEERYGLVRSFRPDQVVAARRALDEELDDPGRAAARSEGFERMYREKVDVTDWYLDLVHEFLA